MPWCWEDLANAIILQAIRDYRYCRWLVRHKPDQKEAQAIIREVERFFGSCCYYQLTDIDGDRLLKALKGEIVWK